MYRFSLKHIAMVIYIHIIHMNLVYFSNHESDCVKDQKKQGPFEKKSPFVLVPSQLIMKDELAYVGFNKFYIMYQLSFI